MLYFLLVSNNHTQFALESQLSIVRTLGFVKLFSRLFFVCVCVCVFCGGQETFNNTLHTVKFNIFIAHFYELWYTYAFIYLPTFSSVQFGRSVVSYSLWPHESQHARPPCPSPTPGVHSDSRPSSQWCHPAISSSIVPFSSCPQSLPASESFPMSQLFSWGG